MNGRSSWKTYLLTLLAVISAAISSLAFTTMAKYTANTDAVNTGRVASWNVAFTNVAGSGASTPVIANSVVYLRYGSANNRTTSTTRYYYIKNNSDVAANVSVKLLYSDVYNTFPAYNSTSVWANATFGYSATGSSNVISGTAGSKTNIVIGPGGTAAFSLTISAAPNAPDNETYCLQAFAYAAQVD